MSVFSKLFSGSPKGETEAASTTTAEEGPSMQRPPNDGRGAGASQQPSPQAQKGTPVATKATQRGIPAAQPPQSRGASGPQSTSGAAKATPAQPADGPGPRPAPAPATGARSPSTSTPAVVVTRPIDVGATTQAAPSRADSASRSTSASRPAMPAISIGPPTAPSPAPNVPSPKPAVVASGDARSSVRPTAPEMTAPASNGQASIA